MHIETVSEDVALLQVLQNLPATLARLNPFLSPASARVPASRRISSSLPRVFVIEPHFDDAALSIGGWLNSTAHPITLITVFSRAARVHPQLETVLREQKVDTRALRRAESDAFCRLLKLDWIGLDFEEHSRRKASISPGTEAVRTALAFHIPPGSPVLLPAAFGGHPDHVCVAGAAAAFDNHLLYEEVSPVPAYAQLSAEFWPHFASLTDMGYQPQHVDVTATIESKISFAFLYRSQFTARQARSLRRVAEAVAQSCRTLAPQHSFEGAFAERLYFLGERPSWLAESVPEPPELEEPLHLDIGGAEHAPFVRARRSRRDFIGAPIGLSDVAAILDLSCRQTGSIHTPERSLALHPYPTAGGRASTCIHLIVWSVEGLPAGLYEYDAAAHTLRRRGEQISRLALRTALQDQDWVLGAACCFLIASRTGAISDRYGADASRLALLEAGHCGALLALGAHDRDLGHVFVGAFNAAVLGPMCSNSRPLGLVLMGQVCGPEPRAFLQTPPNRAGARTSSSAQLSITKHNRLIVARCEIPAYDHASCGWALATEPSPEALARARAIAEARELAVARLAVPATLCFSESPCAVGEVVHPDRVVLDHLQLKHRERSRAIVTESEPIHWVRGERVLDGASVWLPADSVLLSARFWNNRILMTSTGLGCHPSVERAFDHATLEVVEKAVIPAYDPDGVPTQDSDLVSAVRKRLSKCRAGISLRASRHGPLVHSQLLCSNGTRAGACTRWALTPAVIGAVGEACAILGPDIYDVLSAVSDTTPVCKSADWEALFAWLERLGIQLARIELSAPNIANHIPLAVGWPVVKVVAYRAFMGPDHE